MKKWFIVMLALNYSLLFCQKFQVVVDTLGYDCNFRGLCAVNDKVAWASGNKGTVGKTIDGGKSWNFQKLAHHPTSEIRDIQAWDQHNAFILCVKDPAQILKTTDGGLSWKTVFTASNSETFLDGFAFWDKTRGIAFGDPVDGHFEIFTTVDGGETWQQLAKENSPKSFPNEAAFAASGTSIYVGKKGKVWFGTGGSVANIFFSGDYGSTWNCYSTPIIQGTSSQGINSIVFMDNKTGIAIGGDYAAPAHSERNYVLTTDGGQTWKEPNPHKRPGGYRSCVEFINKTTFCTVGTTGIDISYDGGYTWDLISNESFINIDKVARGRTIYISGTKVIGRLIPIK